MKIYSKTDFETKLTDYLDGELPETAWQELEAGLLNPDSSLTEAQRKLLTGLREDERHLQFDSRILEGCKSDAPDPATLRTMVAGWRQGKSRKRAYNLARLGLGFGAGLACLLLVVSLLFSLDGLQKPETGQNGVVVGSSVIATPTSGTINVVIPANALPLSLLYPVKGRNVLVAKFGDKTAESINEGLDIAAVGGTPIVAAADGVVASAGWQADGAGNAVVIHHPGNIYTKYYHLEKVEVSPGQTVKKREQIGIMGTTGDAVGIHLHFEVMLGGLNGAAVDPMVFITEYLSDSHYTEMETNTDK